MNVLRMTTCAGEGVGMEGVGVGVGSNEVVEGRYPKCLVAVKGLS